MIRRTLSALCCLVPGLAIGQTQTVPLTFTPLSSPDTVIAGPAGVMLGAGTAIPTPATSATFTAKGQSVELPLADYVAQITWHSTNRFSVRSGDSNMPLKAVPGTSRFLPVTLNLAEGKKYLLAFPAAKIAKEDGGETTLWYRSGAAMSGKIDDTQVWFYDTNTDGLYKPTEDGVRVGSPERVPAFAPIGPYFSTSAAIYRIEKLAEDGSELSYSRYEGPVGRLKLTGSNPTAELNLLLASDEMAAVAQTMGQPELLLVPGEYRAVLGVLSVPGAGRIAALVKTEEVEPITVVGEQLTNLELGPPYTIRVQAMRNGSGFRVITRQIKLKGKGGEQYYFYRWQGSPEVSIVSGTAIRKVGKLDLLQPQFDAAMPQIPGNNPIRVVVTGTIEGMGVVKGEAPLE